VCACVCVHVCVIVIVSICARACVWALREAWTCAGAGLRLPGLQAAARSSQEVAPKGMSHSPWLCGADATPAEPCRDGATFFGGRWRRPATANAAIASSWACYRQRYRQLAGLLHAIASSRARYPSWRYHLAWLLSVKCCCHSMLPIVTHQYASHPTRGINHIPIASPLAFHPYLPPPPQFYRSASHQSCNSCLEFTTAIN